VASKGGIVVQLQQLTTERLLYRHKNTTNATQESIFVDRVEVLFMRFQS